MPYPPEYDRAGRVFTDFLVDVKVNADFGRSHMAYTLAQGVFQVFRRRLSLKDSIRFSNSLPAGIRALYVADWDVEEKIKSFDDRETMNREVGELRPDHNFAHLADDPIFCVSKALIRYVDFDPFIDLLSTLPTGAKEFWDFEKQLDLKLPGESLDQNSEL